MRELSPGQMRLAIWAIAIPCSLIIVASILIGVLSTQERDAVSHCSLCGVTHYKRYYHFVGLGLDFRLPVGIQAEGGRADDTCPHQITPVR